MSNKGPAKPPNFPRPTLEDRTKEFLHVPRSSGKVYVFTETTSSIKNEAEDIQKNRSQKENLSENQQTQLEKDLGRGAFSFCFPEEATNFIDIPVGDPPTNKRFVLEGPMKTLQWAPKDSKPEHIKEQAIQYCKDVATFIAQRNYDKNPKSDLEWMKEKVFGLTQAHFALFQKAIVFKYAKNGQVINLYVPDLNYFKAGITSYKDGTIKLNMCATPYIVMGDDGLFYYRDENEKIISTSDPTYMSNLTDLRISSERATLDSRLDDLHDGIISINPKDRSTKQKQIPRKTADRNFIQRIWDFFTTRTPPITPVVESPSIKIKPLAYFSGYVECTPTESERPVPAIDKYQITASHCEGLTCVESLPFKTTTSSSPTTTVPSKKPPQPDSPRTHPHVLISSSTPKPTPEQSSHEERETSSKGPPKSDRNS